MWARALGRCRGFGFIDRDDRDLAAAYVDPDCARRGAGRHLVVALQADAATSGLTSLALSSSLNAVPFYLALGWSPGRREVWRHPGGFGLACVRMHKDLEREK